MPGFNAIDTLTQLVRKNASPEVLKALAAFRLQGPAALPVQMKAAAEAIPAVPEGLSGITPDVTGDPGASIRREFATGAARGATNAVKGMLSAPQDIATLASQAGPLLRSMAGNREPIGNQNLLETIGKAGIAGAGEFAGENFDAVLGPLKGATLAGGMMKAAGREAQETARQKLLRELGEQAKKPGSLISAELERQRGVVGPSSSYDIEQRIEKLNRESQSLVEQARGAADKSSFIKQYRALRDEVKDLEQQAGIAIKQERAGSQHLRQIDEELKAVDGLDPQELARLDRAVQQGFKVDAFHGTKGDVKAFDPGLRGVTTESESARLAFFFSADPITPNTYASASDAAKVRGDEPAVRALLNRREYLEQAMREAPANDPNIMDILQPHAEAVTDLDNFGNNIMPVKLKMDNPFIYDFKGAGYRESPFEELLVDALNRGHDGVVFKNTSDGGPITDIYAVFKPEQVRSRYAVFSPDAGPTSDLIAGMAPVLYPVGAGTAALAFTRNKEEGR